MGARGCVECRICDRLRDAILGSLARCDLESVTVPELERRARAPAGALAAHYGTLDTCLLATYDECSERLYRGMVEAFSEPGDWHARFASAVDETLDRVRATPGLARLCFCEPVRGNTLIRQRRAASRRRVIRFLADEYENEQGYRLPDLHFEFLFGALLRAAQDEAAAGRDPAAVAGRVRELLAVLEPVPA